MSKLWIRIKRWLYRRFTQDTVCGKCGEVIPFGKSAWYDKHDQEWQCHKCAPDPW